MFVTTLTENLSKALTTATRFTGGKVQLPVLANILLKTDKNKLTVCATNLETSISIDIGAKVEKEGQITVPGKTISDLVNNLPQGPISIKAENEKVFIGNASFESMVLGVNASDYPSVPQKSSGEKIKLSTSVMSKVLSKTLFSVSNDETRPVLTGMLLLISEGEVSFVSTDGFRLSSKKVKVNDLKVEGSQKLILPKNALAELQRISSDVESVSFDFNNEENQAIFSIGESVLSSRIIQGDYPDFERIVPKNSTIHLEIDKEELLRAIKLASVFARESANVVKLHLQKNGIEVSAESAKSGNQKMKIDVDLDISDDLVVAYNYHFLEELLNCLESDTVKIELTDANIPGLFKDTKDSDYFHIIMPIKLNV